MFDWMGLAVWLCDGQGVYFSLFDLMEVQAFFAQLELLKVRIRKIEQRLKERDLLGRHWFDEELSCMKSEMEVFRNDIWNHGGSYTRTSFITGVICTPLGCGSCFEDAVVSNIEDGFTGGELTQAIPWGEFHIPPWLATVEQCWRKVRYSERRMQESFAMCISSGVAGGLDGEAGETYDIDDDDGHTGDGHTGDGHTDGDDLLMPQFVNSSDLLISNCNTFEFSFDVKRRWKRLERVVAFKRRPCYMVYKLGLSRGFVLPLHVPKTPDHTCFRISKRTWVTLMTEWSWAVRNVAKAWECLSFEVSETV